MEVPALTLLLCESSLSVEVVLEEGNVGLCGVLCAKELLVGRLAERGCLDVLDDALDGRDGSPVVLNVLREVNLWNLDLAGALDA